MSERIDAEDAVKVAIRATFGEDTNAAQAFFEDVNGFHVQRFADKRGTCTQAEADVFIGGVFTNEFTSAYAGTFENVLAFVDHLIDEDLIDVPKTGPGREYFDAERFGEDLEGSDFWSALDWDTGRLHVFWID